VIFSVLRRNITQFIYKRVLNVGFKNQASVKLIWKTYSRVWAIGIFGTLAKAGGNE
jgi:hypothetical protein